MSHASIDRGQLKMPMTGARCQSRSGEPTSTTTKPMAVTSEATARPSPKSTALLKSWSCSTYVGITRMTAAAAMPTRNVKQEM